MNYRIRNYFRTVEQRPKQFFIQDGHVFTSDNIIGVADNGDVQFRCACCVDHEYLGFTMRASDFELLFGPKKSEVKGSTNKSNNTFQWRSGGCW